MARTHEISSAALSHRTSQNEYFPYEAAEGLPAVYWDNTSFGGALIEVHGDSTYEAGGVGNTACSFCG